MASRYYNPRLASSLGAAESNIPINAAGAFERGFMPVFQRGVQIKQKEEQARLAALEKIAERKRKLREDVANEYKDFLYKVQETIPPNQIDLTNQMMQLGKRVFQIAATIEDPMERAEYQMTAIQPIGEISKFWNNEKEISESAAAIIENNMMSKANQFDSDGYEIAMKRYKGDYKQFFDEDLGEFVCEFDIDGEKVSILSEDLQKYNVLPKASEAIKNNNDNELAFIKYIETQKIFPDHPAFNDILNSYLDKFEINTPGEAISILVDHFKIAGRKDTELQQNLKKLEAVLDPYSKSGIRKNEEDNFIYEDIDEQGNKTNEILTGEEAIIEMAKDQYAKVMRSAATNLGLYYNDKDEPESKLTEADKKRAITFQNAFSRSTDISGFKEELGIPTNEAGIAIGDPRSIEANAKLDITSDNFSNLASKLGFRVLAIYRADKDDPNSEIQSIELQQQGGTKKYEVVPGQNSIQFLKDIFRMQGVNENEIPALINNVLYGTFKPANDKYSQYIKQ